MTAPPLQEMGEFLTTVKVPCSVCKKVMSFRNVRRHMKTVHNADGKKWTCSACGKIYQSEQILTQHQRIHKPEVDEDKDENIFKCPDCPYRTLCKNYSIFTSRYPFSMCHFSLTFLHCVFSIVSSNCLHERMQSHIDCICLTFLQCAFSCVPSNFLPEMMHSHNKCICLTFL